MTRSDRDQVVIIGAGAAGLTTARELDAAGVGVTILEARDRIGGRILTVRDAHTPSPIELGAEFIHGTAEPLQSVIAQAALRVASVDGTRWEATGRTLRRLDDFWTRLDRVIRRIKGSRRTDESLDAFLARRPGGESLAAERRLAARFVRGFHAADTALVSTQALAESGSPGEDEREQRLARFVDGYDKVTEWLAVPVHPHLRLSHIVTGIRWSKGEVEVESSHPDGTRRADIRARAAVIAVPLGVLQAAPGETGAIEFDPELTQKSRALQHLAMGPVVRMVFRFRERFWSGDSFSARGRRLDLDSMSFLHTSDRDFPVWWTANPFQSPLLVAWCGGPDARRLAQLDRGALESRAISRLSAHL